MASNPLLDIAPPELMTKKFEIRGGTLEVRGIKTKEWAILIKRFPTLGQTVNGEAIDFATAADELMPAVIATGLGVCGDADTEALILDRLSEQEQMAIFSAIMELTSAGQDIKPIGDTSRPLLVGSNSEDSGKQISAPN